MQAADAQSRLRRGRPLTLLGAVACADGGDSSACDNLNATRPGPAPYASRLAVGSPASGGHGNRAAYPSRGSALGFLGGADAHCCRGASRCRRLDRRLFGPAKFGAGIRPQKPSRSRQRIAPRQGAACCTRSRTGESRERAVMPKYDALIENADADPRLVLRQAHTPIPETGCGAWAITTCGADARTVSSLFSCDGKKC